MADERVLIVEDDAISLKLMRDVLGANGYQTREVINGLDVVASAVDFKAHLVIMDIGLPGINGVEATRQLKSNPATRHIPVLAVTAYAMPGDEERMRDVGWHARMAKPLRFADFISMVGDLLRSAKQ